MSLINTCVLIKSFISPFKSCNAWSKSDKVCIFAGLGAIGAPGAVDVPVYWTIKTFDNPCNVNINYSNHSPVPASLFTNIAGSFDNFSALFIPK